MPRSQGFARGDLDPSFPLDDKFLDLRARLTPERYYAATGVYFHAAAAAWRDAERKTALKTCPDAAEAIADLQSAGLLDADGCVPRRAYQHTVGRALRARKVSTDRKTRNRVNKSPSDASPTGKTRRPLSPGVQNPDQMSRGTERDTPPRHAVSTDIQNRTEQVSTDQVSTGQGDARADLPPLTVAIDYLEERTGRPWHARPGHNLWDTLNADIRDFGVERVLAECREIEGDHPDFAQLIFGATKRLHPIVVAQRPASAPVTKGRIPSAEEARNGFVRE